MIACGVVAQLVVKPRFFFFMSTTKVAAMFITRAKKTPTRQGEHLVLATSHEIQVLVQGTAPTAHERGLERTASRSGGYVYVSERFRERMLYLRIKPVEHVRWKIFRKYSHQCHVHDLIELSSCVHCGTCRNRNTSYTSSSFQTLAALAFDTFAVPSIQYCYAAAATVQPRVTRPCDPGACVECAAALCSFRRCL